MPEPYISSEVVEAAPLIKRCLTHGHPQSTDPEYCWFGVHDEHYPCKFTEEEQ